MPDGAGTLRPYRGRSLGYIDRNWAYIPSMKPEPSSAKPPNPKLASPGEADTMTRTIIIKQFGDCGWYHPRGLRGRGPGKAALDHHAHAGFVHVEARTADGAMLWCFHLSNIAPSLLLSSRVSSDNQQSIGGLRKAEHRQLNDLYHHHGPHRERRHAAPKPLVDGHHGAAPQDGGGASP